MPRGTKSCKSCGHVTGPRSFVCPSCKAPFGMKLPAKKSKVKKKPLKRGKSKAEPKVGKFESGYVPKDRHIYIPAGECPVTLSDFTEEGVLKWRDKIIEKSPAHYKYHPAAFKYWLRDFVPPFSDIYLDLCFVL